jgi:hypothetical protein
MGRDWVAMVQVVERGDKIVADVNVEVTHGRDNTTLW